MLNLDDLIKSNNGSYFELPLIDSEILYYPDFFSKEDSQYYFEQCYHQTPWQQDEIKVFGKTYAQPRLTALYGNSGKTYSYSGITMTPKEYRSFHFAIIEAISSICNVEFTTVLLNLYRDGRDSNGWHSDNEKELGINPEIASVSFGAKRTFHLKHRTEKHLSYKLSLEAGSVLIMRGETQHYWLHQLPKSKNIQDPRINLTFRKIV